MKAVIISLLFFGFATVTYSQGEKVDNKLNLEITNLPEVVIHKAEKDFSVYLRDNNPDKHVNRLQEKFISYDIGRDYEGAKEYLVVMRLRKGSLAATYDGNGKLTRVVEKYKNVRLPDKVLISIYKTYPEWIIVNDKLLYTQSEGEVLNNEYSLKIKKDNDVKRLVVNPNGDILKEL
ncbi:hypothetical protein [Flavobacterium ovatum]|uniref:hypothetical protein n=1 Tax=Flavobacterium ovatum TaxID=1928857 RepID=UPI00344C6268